jgi:hypothetical protein
VIESVILPALHVNVSLINSIVQCSNSLFVCSNFEVDFGSEEHASIVYKTLAVDKEVNKLIFLF